MRIGMVLAVLLVSVWAWAGASPVVTVPDVLVFQGTAMVPVRPMAELLGAGLSASGAGVTVQLGARNITFRLNTRTAQANGTTITLPLAPFEHAHVSYVPVSALISNLGGTLSVDATRHQLTVACGHVTLTLPMKRQAGTPASYWDDDTELYMVNIDGTGLKRLTYDTADDLLPVFSPDGTAWINRHDGGLLLRNCGDPQNTTLLPTTPEFTLWDYAFSPDGQRIVFCKSNEICVMRRDGSGLRVLAHGRQPALSSDGTLIAFLRDTDDMAGQLMLMRLDGTGLTTIGSGFSPRWGADSKTLYARPEDVYETTPGKMLRYDLTPAMTCRAMTPVISDAAAHDATVTADGTHLLYVKTGDAAGLYLRDLVTGAQQRLTSNGEDFAPRMSPDGKTVVFCRGDSFYALTLDSLRLIEIATSRTKQYYLGDATFTPDSRAIIYIDHPEVNVNSDEYGL